MSIMIADFVAQERQRCIKFYEWYTWMHRSDPSHYPLAMDEGEWDEQLQIFDEGNL